VFVEDASGNISIDQLMTSLFGLSIEAIEVNSIDKGIFSVVVGNPQEKERLLNMGCLEINNYFLTISGNSEDNQCPICTISMKNWNELERNSHIISCSNDTGLETIQTFDGPFTLSCPYPNCNGLRIEARFFPAHVFRYHSKDKQNYACPICQLQGDDKYKIKQDTNLMTHLETSHQEMFDTLLGTEPHRIIPPPQKVMNKPKIIYPPQQPIDYIVQIIQNDTQDECPICYEIIVKGIKIARLPCLCFYHQHCIEAWFKQKAARKCPLHGMDPT
jgi:hypothetical protein